MPGADARACERTRSVGCGARRQPFRARGNLFEMRGMGGAARGIYKDTWANLGRRCAVAGRFARGRGTHAGVSDLYLCGWERRSVGAGRACVRRGVAIQPADFDFAVAWTKVKGRRLIAYATFEGGIDAIVLGGFEIRGAAAEAGARICAGRNFIARARNRREHRDLPVDRRDPAAFECQCRTPSSSPA